MNRAINFTIYFLIAAAVILKAPSIMDNMGMEGKEILPNKLFQYNLKGQVNPVVFPIPGKRVVAIFWASWCAPCKIELSRINQALEKNELDKSNIFAISLDQSFEELDKAIVEKKYLFNTYLDKENNFLTKMKITATPTIVLIDEFGKIHEQTTGASINPVGKIKKFLNKE